MTRIKLLLWIAITLNTTGLAACTGDMGPTGPQGPPGATGSVGPQGPAGASYQYFVGSAIVGTNRMADVHLPAGAGSSTRPPTITCYLGTGNTYLIVGTDLAGPSCGMTWLGSNWRVRVLDSPPGWLLLVVAVW